MQLISTLATLLSLPLLGAATGPSYIATPANGTHIAPGAKFPFSYHALGDYCQSSLNINVYIFTTKPKSFVPAQTWTTGSFLGRYSTSQTGPAPPSSFTMPDFSKSPGGFGTGETASNKAIYLAVLEETGTCDAALGARIALNYVTLIYNATSSS